MYKAFKIDINYKKYGFLLIGIIMLYTTVYDWYYVISYSKYEDLVFSISYQNCNNCDYIGILDSILNIILAYFIFIFNFNFKKAPLYNFVKTAIDLIKEVKEKEDIK